MIDLFGLKLHIYGSLIGLAIFVAWEISVKVARVRKIKREVIDQLAWWLIIFGIIGARAYHVIDYWKRYYFFEPVKVFYLWEGGLAIWGAIIGGLFGLLTYQYYLKISGKLFRVNNLDVIDSVSVGLPIAQSIGRIGNWVNRELIGKNGEPLFAIESVLNLGLFFLLWGLSRKNTYKGLLFGIYLCGYGAIRLILENYRKEEDIWRLFSFPVAGWFSVIAISVGCYFVFKNWRGNKHPAN